MNLVLQVIERLRCQTKENEANIHKSQVLMAHACNPSNVGGWDQEDSGSRPAQVKKFLRSHLDGKKLGMGCCTPITLGTVGSLKYEDHSPG
jgi:hypothetical protein